jgi:hypothetical protein
MEASPEPTGVLVIRVWFQQYGLQARITGSHDIARGQKTVTVAGSADEIQATVAEWLRRFTALAGPATRL